MTRLTESYISLVKHLDGRSGPFRRFWTGVIDLSLRRRPRFRSLDTRTRRSAYLDIRRRVESDPRAIGSLARLHYLMMAGAFVGSFTGGALALAWTLPGTTGASLSQAATNIAIIVMTVSIGAGLGVIAGSIAWRTIAARTGPSRAEWNAYIDDALTRASAGTASA